MTKLQKDLALFKVFLLAGTFTFTGGMAMLPVIHRELVEKRQMIKEEDFYEYATIAQTLPGVIALSTACLIGEKCNGKRGALVAAIGAILPAYGFMTLATLLYQFIPQGGAGRMALTGVRATCAAFVLAAGISLAKHNMKDKLAWAIATVSFIAIALFNISAPYIILAASLLGILLEGMQRQGGEQ